MKVAVVLTVKNEERILRKHVQYHHFIGADKIFVYFDNTTDEGKTSLRDLPYVEIQDSVPATTYTHLPFLNKFTSKATEHHTARQCLNTYDAKCRCEKEGIDWLISIDADELICTEKEKISNLPAFFKRIPASTNVVYFKTKEVLQQQTSYSNVFKEESWFKATPFFTYRWEKIYKSLYNPFTGKQLIFSFWYGQTMGKAAIKVTSNVIPKNVHRYTTETGTGLEAVKKGLVLHYHCYDGEDFIKKFLNFKNRATTFLSGNKVDDLKLLLKAVVNHPNFSREYLMAYFKENLLFQANEVKKLKKNTVFFFLKRRHPAIEEITSVQQAFQQLENSSV